MKMKLLMVIVVLWCFLSYMYGWYQGESVPAWHAAIWTFCALITEITEYLEEKEYADWN